MSITVIEPGSDQVYATLLNTSGMQHPAAVDKSTVIELFKQHGAVLFRGFLLTPDSLDALTSEYCSGFVKNITRGRIAISGDGRTQSVNVTPKAFPLHPEMSQTPWRPDVAWFACAYPPEQGGETTLCDGIALADHLPDKTREHLKLRTFLYRRKTVIE